MFYRSRREFLKAGVLGAAGAALAPRPLAAPDREVLYNGIVLPHRWPPSYSDPAQIPIAPPYLDDPPAVIDIDVGRQLFVDDFLIEETTLRRTFHHAVYHRTNPVLRPKTAWEQIDVLNFDNGRRTNPTAMPFSDGVFWDPRVSKFRLWYMCGYGLNVCHAESHDGIEWARTTEPIVPGTNIVFKGARDSTIVWLDHFEQNPQRRYKLSVSVDEQLKLFASPDGLQWTPVGSSGRAFDRSTFFYNPFRRKWVFSIRGVHAQDRVRYYREGDDFVGDAKWRESDLALWAAADRFDAVRPGWASHAELYNLDAVAYESVLLGLFSIWRGEPPEREKVNDVCLGFSRDGFHWYRPDRTAFIGVSETVGDWNWANVQSAGGGCLIVGDHLYFYVSGRSGIPGTSGSGRSSTGLAILRRDGFASMDRARADLRSRAALEATLTTRVVRFTGSHLFVNADLTGGEMRVEVLDDAGRVLAPFTRAACTSITGDSPRAMVTWRGAESLHAFAGQDVRFRFYVAAGRLYAFWVSPSSNGASRGYVAAGGPGLSGPIDTIGDGSSRARQPA